MTVILAFVLFYLWKALIFRPEDAVTLATGMPKQPIVLAFLSAMCAAFSLFLGIFLAGQSHVLEFRWLRPVGAWLMAGALVMCFTLISSLLAQFEFPAMGRILLQIHLFRSGGSLRGAAAEFYQ